MFWFGKRKPVDDEESVAFEEFRRMFPKYVKDIDRVERVWKRMLKDCLKYVKGLSKEDMDDFGSRADQVIEFCCEKMPKMYEHVLIIELMRAHMLRCYAEEICG